MLRDERQRRERKKLLSGVETVPSAPVLLLEVVVEAAQVLCRVGAAPRERERASSLRE